MNAGNLTYFDSFDIPKEIIKLIVNKNVKINIYIIQAYDSIICGYFCIGFIYFKFIKAYKFILLMNIKRVKTK